MASSLSSAAQKIHLLGGGTVFRQRSSINSNRVSFGLAPQSSFLTLSSSSNARTANSILSVAAKGSSDTSIYDALERLAVEAGKILVKEVANMFEEASKQLPAGAAGEVKAEEAAKKFVAREMKEKKSDDIDETKNHSPSGEDTFFDDLKELAMIPGIEKELAKAYGEAKEVFGGVPPSPDEIKRWMEEVLNYLAECEAKGRRWDDIDTQKHSASGVEGWVEAIDEFCDFIKPYLKTVRDSYDVGDYIKVRIGTDVIEGTVISKDYNVTKLETFRKSIVAIDNHKISGWVEIQAKRDRTA